MTNRVNEIRWNGHVCGVRQKLFQVLEAGDPSEQYKERLCGHDAFQRQLSA
jgi:hypothetical protein